MGVGQLVEGTQRAGILVPRLGCHLVPRLGSLVPHWPCVCVAGSLWGGGVTLSMSPMRSSCENRWLCFTCPKANPLEHSGGLCPFLSNSTDRLLADLQTSRTAGALALLAL